MLKSDNKIFYSFFKKKTLKLFYMWANSMKNALLVHWCIVKLQKNRTKALVLSSLRMRENSHF